MAISKKLIRFLSIACVTGLFSGCKFFPEPVSTSRGEYTQIQELMDLSGYNYVEIAVSENSLNTEIDQRYLDNLFTVTRQSFVHTNVFKSVNGLASSTYRPTDRNLKENTKKLLVTQELIDFNTDTKNPTITVNYTFTDGENQETIGMISVKGQGGVAGVNSAIHGIGYGIKKALYEHTKHI